MSLKTVCNVCLAMDRPVYGIADNPLQDVYIKLTDTSLNTMCQPMVACHLCYSQLRKCHNLMVRSVRAHKMLTQVLQCGEVVNEEFMTMIKLESRKLMNTLDITPVEVISITSIDQHCMKVELNDDPLSQCKEEMEVVTATLDDGEGSDNEGEEDSEKEGPETALDSEGLRYEGKTNAYDLESLKFEESEDEDVTAAWDTGESIDNERWMFGENIKQEEPEAALDTDSMEHEGAAQAKECKEIHTERMEAGTTLTPDDVMTKKQKSRSKKKLRTSRKVIEEEGPHRNRSLHITDKAVNKRQIPKRTSIYSDTALNKDNLCENSDNDCSRTNIDVGNEFSNNLKTMFISNDPDDVVDDKCLLEHNKEEKSVQTSEDESLYGNTILKKNTIKTGIVKKKTKTFGDKKRFGCNISQKKTTQKVGRKAHLKTHTIEKPFICEICAQRFQIRNHLAAHLRKHNGEKPFECDICQARFHDERFLKRHLKRHTCEKSFKCDICQKTLRTKRGLTNHILRHTGKTGKKPFECTICQRRLCNRIALTSHLRTHTLEKPYECNLCQRKFSFKTSLHRHSSTHTGAKPFKCEQCQRRFSDGNHLKLHLLIHTGATPFECDVCQSSFSRKDTLKAHLRIHTGERPFKCVICQRRFNQGSSLKTHMRTHNR